MSFSDHKITAFQHKITDLPDQPTLAPNELKARFDSSPEELRQAVNGICDDASRLEARVEGIVVDTFGDTIDREMLSDELAAELDAKAEQTALTSEAQTRETAVSALDTRVAALETAVPEKCEIYLGTYTGTGESTTQTITLGYQPKAVIAAARSWEGNTYEPQIVNMILPNADAPNASITATGFTVTGHMNSSPREVAKQNPYRYIVFK